MKTELTKIAGLDLVRDTLIDPMHLIYLGVTRNCMTKCQTPKSKARLDGKTIDKICQKLKQLRPYFPSEFNRQIPAITEIHRFKATELSHFLLYGFLQVKHLFPKHIQDHFLLFTCAARILNDPSSIASGLNVAKRLLEKFYNQAGEIYGDEIYDLNMHNLTHIVDDIQNASGDMSKETCFEFENFKHCIKLCIKFGPDPLVQACARDIEMSKIERRYETPPDVPVLDKQLNQTDSSRIKFGEISFPLFKLDNSKRNCYFMTEDKRIMKFVCVEIINSDLLIVCNRLRQMRPAFVSPIDASFLKIFATKDDFDSMDLRISPSTISCKMFCLLGPRFTQNGQTQYKKIFCPVLHTLNY